MVFIICLGALILLYAAMALRMSMYRLGMRTSKVKVESEDMILFSEAQLLLAEWLGPIGLALLGCHLKFHGTAHSNDLFATAARYAALAVVASRFVFALAAVITLPMLARISTMTVCYTSIIVLGAVLVL
jgi:hypothetical protein